MISEREKKILRIIVEEYIKTAKPVSSSHICKEMKCSSATIRNEMVYLSDLGYLEKNHFASGRIPSELGYKYYVVTNKHVVTLDEADKAKYDFIGFIIEKLNH